MFLQVCFSFVNFDTYMTSFFIDDLDGDHAQDTVNTFVFFDHDRQLLTAGPRFGTLREIQVHPLLSLEIFLLSINLTQKRILILFLLYLLWAQLVLVNQQSCVICAKKIVTNPFHLSPRL